MEKERNAGARRSYHEDGVGTVSWTGKMIIWYLIRNKNELELNPKNVSNAL